MPYDDVAREPTSQLIHHVIDDVRELFREEVALACADVREELSAWSTAAARTRLGRDLTRLGRRIDAMKDNAAARAQWWGGVAAIAAGVVGALVLWPRSHARG